MAIDNEKFLKAKRFLADFDLDDTNDLVLVKLASLIREGKVRLATQAETVLGTSETLAVTPKSLKFITDGLGSAITAKDEGSNLTTALKSINFAGAGVVASTVGDDVTVTIAGGGGGGGLTIEAVDSYDAYTNFLMVRMSDASIVGLDLSLLIEDIVYNHLPHATTFNYGMVEFASEDAASSTVFNEVEKVINPAGLFASLAAFEAKEVPFSPAPATALYAPNLLLYRNHLWDLSVNGTLDTPANVMVGRRGSIWIKQDAVGGQTLTFNNAVYLTANGVAKTISTSPNALTRIDYWVVSSTIIQIEISKDFA